MQKRIDPNPPTDNSTARASRRATKQSQTAAGNPATNSVARYFTGPATRSNADKMAEQPEQTAPSGSASPATSSTSLEDIWVFLRGLPTKSDLDKQTDLILATTRSEAAALREEVVGLADRISGAEANISQLQQDVQLLKEFSEKHTALSNFYRAGLEDLQNRNRRNNVRIRGLPEATRSEDLQATVQAIFDKVLDHVHSLPIRLDRVHRALRALPQGDAPPRDVICRVHHYDIKEAIMVAARRIGGIDFDGAQITLFQDLAPFTLAQRKALRPLLQALQNEGAVYHWGFPFHLHAKLGARQAILRTPKDLNVFCSTLEIDPVPLPLWDPDTLTLNPPQKKKTSRGTTADPTLNI